MSSRNPSKPSQVCATTSLSATPVRLGTAATAPSAGGGGRGCGRAWRGHRRVQALERLKDAGAVAAESDQQIGDVRCEHGGDARPLGAEDADDLGQYVAVHHG